MSEVLDLVASLRREGIYTTAGRVEFGTWLYARGMVDSPNMLNYIAGREVTFVNSRFKRWARRLILRVIWRWPGTSPRASALLARLS